MRDLFSPILGDERGVRGQQETEEAVPLEPVPAAAPTDGTLPPPTKLITAMGEEAWSLSGGEVLPKAHPHAPDCDKHGCVIHNPSKHCTDDLPQHFRSDTGLMERICPHGTGHPDPDSVAYFLRQDPKKNSWVGIHGCCGVTVDGVMHSCCSEEARAERDKARASVQPR